MKTHRLTRIGGILALSCAWALGGATLTVIPGCEDDNVAEDIGEGIDDAADDVGDAVDDAVDEVEDAAD